MTPAALSFHAELYRQLEGHYHVPLHPEPRAHAPLINHARTCVVGCTCGWRTPPDTTDSDTTFTWHYAIAHVTEGRL